jgi:peptide/nickel transport system permease protein
MTNSSKTPLPANKTKTQRLALWLQFPRRIVMLLLAYGLCAFVFAVLRGMLGRVVIRGMPGVPPVHALPTPDWTNSIMLKQPVSEVVGQTLPATLLLLGLAFAGALLISLVGTIGAAVVRYIEKRNPGTGFVLNRLGRMWIFADIALPSFVLGLGLMYIFAIQLKVLPLAGIMSVTGDLGSADRIHHLILPVCALIFLPAALAAQAAARRMRTSNQGAGRTWITGLLTLLAGLLRQTGGILVAVILVEVVFAWPGLGRLVIRAVQMMDLPVLMGCAVRFTVLILGGRVLSELFEWLARLADPEPGITPAEADSMNMPEFVGATTQTTAAAAAMSATSSAGDMALKAAASSSQVAGMPPVSAASPSPVRVTPPARKRTGWLIFIGVH